jgi:hypothetical protein
MVCSPSAVIHKSPASGSQMVPAAQNDTASQLKALPMTILRSFGAVSIGFHMAMSFAPIPTIMVELGAKEEARKQ